MNESGRLTAVETTTSRYQLLGWLLVVENQSHQRASAQLELGLDCFTGNHGKLKVIHTREGFGFGFRRPQTPLLLSQWSCFSDRDYICFVEGVFYENYLSHSPPAYEDEQLARLLLTEYLTANARAFERLNGSFSGFIFDSTHKSLFTFVDRLSTRVLYWSHIDSNLIVSTNLGGFRPFKKLALDYVSAFQFLTVGFPVGERTLLEGIHLQRPCSVNVFNKQKQYSLCYWDLPKRAVKMSVRDAADLLASSMETFVTRVYARSREKLAFGLSGGHDSRVVLSALAYAGIPFEVINRWERNFNHRVALQLCSLVDKTPTVVRDFSDAEIAEMKDRAFDYSDGNVTHSLDFVYLARQCFESDLSCLLLGFAGDKISGSLTIPAPEYFETIEQLANTALGNQMELFSLSEARSLLKSADPSVIDATLSEWTQSFAREGRREYLTDICIWQALSNRNVRRIRFAMAPAMQYAQVLLPY
jgi:asparagine synthetase B (glutamine-hydrolysing)